MSAPLLTVLTFLPAAGAAVVVALPRRDALIRWVALLVAIATFVVSLALYADFDLRNPGYQFEERLAWMPTFGIAYHLGVDGISLLLVLLTAFLSPLALLSSWRAVEVKLKEFAVTMLLLETGMLGVFVSLDLFLFYIFWEAMLIPMYFIIGVWGG
ncbi:MAG: Fe-S-binding domain-containing protein, partial [Candidatus Rokubacteria bacterium]|nr:Fe-S-binding domain-containing protein [Candidatus Rokubacteria bacterium]